MKCILCGGEIKKKKKDVTIVDSQGRLVLIEGVPYNRCSKCLQETYSIEVVEYFDSLKSRGRKEEKEEIVVDSVLLKWGEGKGESN